MASTVANLLPSPLLVNGRNPQFAARSKFLVSAIGERQRCLAMVVKAASDSSESSSSLSIVKSVQSVWDKPEDRLALIGLGFAGVVGIWASINLVTAIEKLPVVPSTLEAIGIFFSTWFVYRYLLFKPDREELVQIINKSVSEILGQ